MHKQRNDIVKGLHAHVGVNVVPTDTADRKPKYPYMSYKIITSHDSNTFSLVDAVVPSTTSGFEHDVKVTSKEQAHFTMSVNAYSLDEDEAHNLAAKAADWFKFHGYHYLVGCNIVVISVGSVADRTAQIVDDYERRYGFDVRIRAARGITKRVETIESHNIIGTLNRPRK